MILIFLSSLNENAKLAHTLQEQLEELGQKSTIIHLVDLDLPLYTSYKEEHDGIPPAIDELTKQMQSASAYLIVAPEYNFSIPPILTNAIAWISRSNSDFRSNFANKPIQLATHSGSGGSDVMNAMRTQLTRLGAIVMPREILTNYNTPLQRESSYKILNSLVKFIF
jgi:NAD(P)H-dependent FMN reductase